MHNSSPLMQTLKQWVQAGALRSVDLSFAQFIAAQSNTHNEALLLAAALVSERNSHGHVCLDLRSALEAPHSLLSATAFSNEASAAKEALAERLSAYNVASWSAEIAQHSAVDTKQNQTGNTPFVLAGTPAQPLLYLRRYWYYEQRIKAAMRERLANPPAIDENATKQLLAALFAKSEQTPDWQKIACLLATKNRFAIITGGPGTGKTTTVVRLLALLQGLNQEAGLPYMRIDLAAPTGKAAARLKESITGSISELGVDNQLKAQLPTDVLTLHRLLGTLPNSRHFRHHAANPLHTDCVVVDEASMMDVEMMAQLVDALPSHARLILLGDKDQLASVEAGSVLGDLCHNADKGHYTPFTAAKVGVLASEALSNDFINPNGSSLAQATAMLRHSYRFSDHPGIGALAKQVNTGEASAQTVLNTIEQHSNSLHELALRSPTETSALQALAVAGYADYLNALHAGKPNNCDADDLAKWAKDVFTAHSKFQLLTAVRRGNFGLENINLMVQSGLQKTGLLPQSIDAWYHGRPILITQNNYSLRLMNGDVGICMQWPDGSLRVAFPEGDKIRWLLPSRLQGAETVFAMTVHKSQGSEFAHTVLVLPELSSPVLTKELIYTAITRSKEQFTLVHSNKAVLNDALTRRVSRHSGLLTLEH